MGNTNSTSPPPLGHNNKDDTLKLFSTIRPAIRALRYNLALVSLGALMSIALAVLQISLQELFLTRTAPPDGQASIFYWPLLISIPFLMAGLLISIFMKLVVADGAHQEKEPFTTYVSRAIRLLLRVLASYLAAGLAIIVPIIGVVIIIGTCLALVTLLDIPAVWVISVILAIIGGLSALIWSFIAFIRYGLVGLIAIFEPEISVLSTRKRSRQLQKGTGSWYVFKLGLLNMIAMLIIMLPFYAYMLTAIAAHEPPQNFTPPDYLQSYSRLTSLAFIIINILSLALMVILYLNLRSKMPELKVISSSKRNLKMTAFALLVTAGTVTLLLSISSVKNRYRLQQQQVQLQQAAQREAAIENALMVYTNKESGYALKLPHDFVPDGTDPNFGEKYVSGEEVTPFVVMVKTVPKDPKLVYADNDAANEALETNVLVSLDNKLQELAGTSDIVTVAGNSDIQGTNHDRVLFARGHATDNDGYPLTMRVIFVPKNDGTALMVTVVGLAAYEQQNDPAIDAIFKSIDLRPI